MHRCTRRVHRADGDVEEAVHTGRELLGGHEGPEHQVDEEELARQVHHALHRRRPHFFLNRQAHLRVDFKRLYRTAQTAEIILLTLQDVDTDRGIRVCAKMTKNI